ncbi:inositol monophosphatase family protein [Jeotgalicoccus meleagridis]|jgi:myo-inositol-1(or 4)-monophosphatase|uniref:Inositol-1-monophosphatase n=1 Tax=Jeotgalicoccus meleagridis TaxID=2759181 RepID=A0A6V7RMR1_9STAP|nr:inositol monophosphatase family protein [Jeotgalicoccus meleagridis]CAD2079465.1 Inositol-1-monophosphatase [Jeotgalicoccus meleagridis]
MDIYNFAKDLIVEAGQFIEKRMLESFHVDSKSNPDDLVTDVDRETEQFLSQRISEQYPTHRIIGEEGQGHDVHDNKGVLWIIDPIDGTLNFVHQSENFAISIGIFIDGQPYCGLIYDCMKADLYHAKYKEGAFLNNVPLEKAKEVPLSRSLIAMNPKRFLNERIRTPFFSIMSKSRSVRSYGSAALEFTMLARGQISALLFFRLHPWDYAGGVILTNELGYKTSNVFGQDLPLFGTTSVIAGNPLIHQELLAYFENDKDLKSLHDETHNL